MTDELNRFLIAAQRRFGLFDDEKLRENPFYISVSGKKSSNIRLEVDSSDGVRPVSIDPLLFLSGITGDNQSTLDSSPIQAESPFVCILVGQYGIGKTEFVAELCRQLLRVRSFADAPLPLPIKLVTCRNRMPRDWDALGKTDFSEFLFGSIANDLGIKADFFQETLLPKITTGKILLLLDGMDELIQERHQHTWFMESLSQVLSSGPEPPNLRLFKVVCTMREGLLSMVSSRDAKNFMRMLNNKYTGGREFALYFLSLDFFERNDVITYFRRRLIAGKELPRLQELLDRLIDTETRQFWDMLRRPLLVKLLADWTEFMEARAEDLEQFLKANAHPLHVLKLYVKAAVEDHELQDAQREIIPTNWDVEKIANKYLVMYRERRVEMYADDIKDILIPRPEGDAEALASIHKCPFFSIDYHRDGSDRKAVVHFSHKIFYEYFTATGMWANKPKNKDASRFVDFDELVLNVDMRKFLRELAREPAPDQWYDLTRLSYALEEEHWREWRIKEVGGSDGFDLYDKETYDRLESQRRALLDLMTDPETYIGSKKDQIRSVISRLLDEESRYHPRYLVFNYEAVTEYVWRHIKKEDDDIREKFSEILRSRCASIVDGLRGKSLELRKPWELLLYQALDNASRLFFEWIVDYKDRDYGNEICQNVQDEPVRSRLEGLFSDIREMYT